MSYYGEEDWECPKCGGEIFMNKELTGATDFYYEWNCRQCGWTGMNAKRCSTAEHPDDYDKCDCKGLSEHAKAMGTSPLLAIPKEPYGD